MESARTSSPVALEADEDDDSSSAYVRTIKRLIQRTQSVPASKSSLMFPVRSRLSQYDSRDYDQHSIEIRSLSSVNDYACNLTNQQDQFETSFISYDNEFSTDNPHFELEPPSADYATKTHSFPGRYQHSKRASRFSQDQDLVQEPNSDELSDSSDPDLNTKWSWKNLKREFKLSHSESLFHLYQAKLQHSFFVALLILNIIFNLGAVLNYAISYFKKYHDIDLYMIVMRLASIVVFVYFLILVWFNKLWMQSKFSRTVASLAVLLAMTYGEAGGAICALVNDQATPLANIRRTYYLIITNHVFLPFPTRIQSCAATIVVASLEIIVTYISRRLDTNCRAKCLVFYLIADIIFYASSALIGFLITFLLEIAIRRTFLNHRYCIQSTYKLNYEKEQQEQLLRSCFPQHLIEQIREEIRESITLMSERESVPFKPFYNLYVEKYENVTILYGDIVNSMNLTDRLNPAELVETLNELYGRFDESAEKYDCLRIKLLGDCYYCVSGLPEYDEDHAMKCLLMGLDMIKIINSVKQSKNLGIDMRIGIHSGSVLSGLLGLRKWQFDIWSFDAMKASRMEHSGQPGFVHITQKTLDLLSIDHIRRRNLIITATKQRDDSETTYLISERVCTRETNTLSHQASRRGQTEKLKAYIEKLRVRSTGSAMDFSQRRMALESSLKKYREIHEKVDETMKKAIADMPLGSAWKQFFFIDCIRIGGNGRSRNDDTELGELSNEGITPIDSVDNGNKTSYCFEGTARTKSKRMGRCGARTTYRGRLKARSKSSTTVKSPSNQAFLRTDPLFHLYLICVGLITLSILAIKCFISMPFHMHSKIGFAFLFAIIVVSTIYTQAKSRKINIRFRILLWLIISSSLTLLQLVDVYVLTRSSQEESDRERDSLSCDFGWYNTFTIIVAMTATSIFIRINVWLKFIIHLSTVVVYIIINEFRITYGPNNDLSILDRKQETSNLFYIVMIAIMLHLIDRQVEYILSLNVKWNEQLESDRVESQTVGQINRILLENILPPHVLKRYLYNTAVSYDQLYHESHPSCAVMFASIPNYENNLNEQGLKCLQLLNEIICDFDQLLSHPAFRTVEKIKTIGSAYMAACFDVSRRSSDCTIDGPEVRASLLHAPDGLKTGWINPLMYGAGSGDAGGSCSCHRASSETNCPVHGRPKNQYRNSLDLDQVEVGNVVTMVCFATALMENLARINRDAFQEFRLRIGIAIGPVIAGVVGASKPTYDIWGDTVNVASRLESSGISGRIQVSEQVAQILCKHGQFEVECRGPIDVKGKGRLTTYLVITPYDSIDLDPKDDAEFALDEAQEPPPTLEYDEVEELCADRKTKFSGQERSD